MADFSKDWSFHSLENCGYICLFLEKNKTKQNKTKQEKFVTIANPDIRAEVRLDAFSFPRVRKSLLTVNFCADSSSTCFMLLTVLRVRRASLCFNKPLQFKPFSHNIYVATKQLRWPYCLLGAPADQ